jgi:iron complex outermembrane receptor protein
LIDSTGNDNQKSLLGDSNTDWQDEIYRTGFSSDNNITFGGGIKKLPYRVSVGYLHNEGVLLRSQFDRTSATLNLNPSLLQDHLKVDVNFKFGYTRNFFADQGAIGSSVTFDPTHPVHSDTTTYGGYFEWLTASTGSPNTLAPRNPVGLINQKDDVSNVYRSIGNIQLDYKLHFFPALRANLNLGGDWFRSNGTVFIDSTAAAQFLQGGQRTQYKQDRNNKLFEFYLNYLKEFTDIHSKFDLTAGYSYQDWVLSNPTFPALNAAFDTITPAGIPFKTQHTLISFYGRLNYTFLDRYLLTATLRDDGSSRFSPDTRWGLFPSVAVAWRISDEPFLRGSRLLSNLKLRLGYGITGQQDVNADYPYIAYYTQSDSTAQYQFGDQYYYLLRPDGYDANIKWEETETFNAGLDFGFLNGRISGSIDIYKKLTSDLLAQIPVPAGSNFTNSILTNVGNIENKGVELTLNLVPFDTKDFFWEFGGNLTYNKNEITKLSKVQDTSSAGILVGGIAGGVGSTIQIHSVGYSPYSFYVYQQLYDEDGNPIEGSYADLNGDSIINQDDKVRSHDPAPKVFIGFYSSFNFRQWSAGFSLRANIGNYVYNNVNSQYANYSNIDGSKNYMGNVTSSYYDTEFKVPQFLSDYYLEDGSFLRMDNISLGYNFNNLIKDKLSLKVTGVVQNVFVISGYSGLDPEVFNGIDNNVYPRPRIFSLILDLKF